MRHLPADPKPVVPAFQIGLELRYGVSGTAAYKPLRAGGSAGSTTNLFDCVRQAIKFGFDEEVAVKMASENPARLMKLNKGKIEIGYDADFIIVDDDFNLVKAIARGEF